MSAVRSTPSASALTDQMDSLSSRLKKWRRLNGIKQEALAQMLGVSQSAISFWESGREQPGIANTRKLEELIDRSAHDQALIERLFIRRQTGIRALFDLDGVRLLETSAGYKAHWPDTALLEQSMMADHLVNEAQDILHNAEHVAAIRRGEIGLISAVSTRLTDYQLDSELKCTWHVCFRRYGARTLLDLVFDPCPPDTPVGIIDVQTLG